MTSSPTTAPDPRPLLARALDQTGELIAGVRAEQANLPTPCTEFDVAGLIGHQQGVVRRIAAVMAGLPFDSVSTAFVSTDWTADWSQGRTAVDAVLAEADLDRLVTVPWGQVPARGAAGAYIGELTVHAWDLASATGQTDRLDDTLARTALPAYQRMLPAQPRGGPVPFGDVVPTADGATPYEQLVAWTGRNPDWSA